MSWINEVRKKHQEQNEQNDFKLKCEELAEAKNKIEEQRNILVKERDELKGYLARLEDERYKILEGHQSLENEINFLKFRIQKLDELHESVVWKEWPHDGSMSKWKCMLPFERIEILPRGEVYTCCSAYIKHNYYIGNIFEDSFENIWNSEKAKKLRYSVSNGNFEYCQKICKWFHRSGSGSEYGGVVSGGIAYNVSRSPFVERTKGDCCESWKDCEVSVSPKLVVLTCDESCNLSCPTCRSSVKALDKKQADELYQRLQAVLPSFLEKCELLAGLSSGEIFASYALSKFYKTITSKLYPKLTLAIVTNLQLLTEEKWLEFENLHDIPIYLHVSVDAAEKEIYEINRRGASWEKLIKNLLYFKEWRKRPDNKIEFLELSFVVQKNNYHQMRDFVLFAEEMGADVVEFQQITNWGTFSDEEFMDRNVLNPRHPEYQKANDMLSEVIEMETGVKVMQNLI